MFDFSWLISRSATITLIEHSMIVATAEKKCFFIAAPQSCSFELDPPGIKGFDETVDPLGRPIEDGDAHFENGKTYLVEKIDVDEMKETSVGESVCTRVSLTLGDIGCRLSFSSERIKIRVARVYDLDKLKGRQAVVSIDKNRVLIELDDGRWCFSARRDNYLVGVTKDGAQFDEHTMFAKGVRGRIVDIRCFDDMLGETAVDFDLFFSYLSIDLRDGVGNDYCIESETDVMNVEKADLG